MKNVFDRVRLARFLNDYMMLKQALMTVSGSAVVPVNNRDVLVTLSPDEQSMVLEALSHIIDLLTDINNNFRIYNEECAFNADKIGDRINELVELRSDVSFFDLYKCLTALYRFGTEAIITSSIGYDPISRGKILKFLNLCVKDIESVKYRKYEIDYIENIMHTSVCCFFICTIKKFRVGEDQFKRSFRVRFSGVKILGC